MEPNGRVALVTGAARRLGRTIAQVLHRDGFSVVLHCRSSVDEANELCNQLNSIRGDSSFVVTADLSKNITTTCRDLVADTVAQWKRLDVLVNNASAFSTTPFGSITEEDWSNIMDTNAKAPFFLMQECMPHLKAVQGCVINLTDLLAERPLPTHSVHCISKMALVTATQAVALAAAPEVRVNSIAPGCVFWPEVDLHVFNDEMKLEWKSKTPLGRIGIPEDVAEVVSFLASAKSSFITGQNLQVDGGRGLAL